LPYVIDTSIAIHLRDGDLQVRAKLQALGNDLLLSVISRVELESGVYRDPAEAAARRTRVDLILAAIPVLPFDDDAAAVYGGIVRALGYSRRKMLDRMIAAQALIQGAPLITMNGADFRGVPGLQVIEW
jgi:predicted nucleic acid-binding protein